MKKTILSIALLSAAMTAMADEARWLSDVQISPDGTQVLFAYKGDIYKVSARGGNAVRLTTQPSYEADAIWSPDGRSIAFTSDRHGNKDIFIMSADGGKAKRLTYNSARETPTAFTPDGRFVLYNAAIQKQAESMLFNHRSQTEVYKVSVDGGRPVQILGTPAETIVFTADGKGMYYQDRKGGEDDLRKHHTSSITRDIWHYDIATKRHTNITHRAGEDRNPVVTSDGKTLFFLSERNGGSFNVWSCPASSPSAATAVTSYSDYPVRYLSMSNDGMLCYVYDGDIYTMRPGQKAERLTIAVTRDDDESIATLSPHATRDAAISPDGKQLAFVSRGEIFVTVTGFTTTRKITDTAAAEASPSFSPDGRTLVYSSYRDGRWQLYKSTIARKADANFANAATFKEERIMTSDLDCAYPSFSPNGKEIAYIEGRNRLMVRNVATGKTRQITDGRTWMSRSGGFDYQWSPDGKWFTLEFIGNKRDPYSDIGIVSAQGGTITNITESAYSSGNPQWVLGGNAIMFLNERYGMRNHASWGSENDVFLAFTNQDAYDRFQLSEEDYKQLKEMEDNAKKKGDGKESDKAGKKKGKGNGSDKKGKDAGSERKDSTKTVTVEIDGIQDRIVRLTPTSSDIRSAILSKDGEKLYYMTRSNGDGSELWSLSLRKKDFKLVRTSKDGGQMIADKDGNIFILGRSISKMDGKSEKTESVTFAADMKLNLADEREFLLQYMRHEVGERFYNTNMHGVKWDALVDHYSQFLPHISNNYDFQRLLSEILGELNVSHTGGRYYHPAATGDDNTAQLGLLLDETYTGDGARVTCVLAGGPFDRKASKAHAGSIITAINGVTLTKDMDIAQLLNGQAGKKTLVTFSDGHDEMVKPISLTSQDDLLYDRWVKRCEHIVDSVSNGRLGYVHLRSMGDPSFRTAYSAMLGKYNLRDGCVIDTRWNGGGRLHEDIEILTSGQKYLTQVIRGEESCDMPSRRYNKPTIMLQCEANYSNAHGTPWVYKHMGIGKLVGAPVPGTMTSVNWVTTQDPSLIFGIPVIGYLQEDGKTYLENSQLDPDILILNAPEDIVRGIDTQLITATKQLLKDIDSKKK